MAKAYKIVCDKEFLPLFKHLNCCKVEERPNGEVDIETTDPVLCQCLVKRHCKNYMLIFGNTYEDIYKGNYFTVPLRNKAEGREVK